MSVPDVLNHPWALTREKFELVCAVYDRHLAGEKLDPQAIKTAIGGPAKDVYQAKYTVEDGVAIIPVDGVLAKKMNLFTQISGGMSTQMLVDTVNEALADSSVHSLMLSIDSPGGEVDGTQQLADAVAKATKPTAAWVDGMACSAAFWVASQCDAIYAASDTSTIGSMGVLIQHADYSRADHAKGKTVTHIATGKYKTVGSSAKPLSDDDRDYLQARVDYLYGIFLTAVADGRGMDPQKLNDTAGDAQVFFAQQAVDNGLIDGIASEADVIAKLNAGNQQRIQTSTAPGRIETGAIQQPVATAASTITAQATGDPEMSVYKSFASEAEYRAEIAAAEARGAAENLTAAQQRAKQTHDFAASITRYIARVKVQEGRTINSAVAYAEMEQQGLVPKLQD